MKELETVVQDEKNKWILITGILQVLACVIMNKFDISNPNIILFVILSAVLVQFGYGAGMLCGFITYIYSMYFFSTDHSFFYFDASNRDKIMVVIFGIIANILIVGSLKARMEKSNKERIHQLEVATTLNKCAVELSADRDIHTAIYNLLGIINQYFQADRSYIFDIDHEKQIVINTYEYTAEGVTRQIDNLQSVPLSVIAVWMDNPKVHFDDATLLLSLQYFIVNSQSSQRQQERLQFLSFRDMLTGLYNRNKYMKVLETFEKYPVCDTGVAYIDLNGLKQINDNLGHEAGDRLLCDAAKEILRTFPENSYRIGGDEFVIILPESGKAEFEEQMEQVQEDLKQAHISYSMGLEWKKEGMLESMLKAAEQRMYAEKNAYYKLRGRDRRCPERSV